VDGRAAVCSDEIAALHGRVGTSGNIRMPKLPKPFVGRDYAFLVAPIRGSRLMPPTGDDHRQHGRQLFRHLQIALVAGLVEGGKDVVGYAPAVTAFPVGRRVGGRIAH
jgi:hypothetical protein